MEFAYANVGPEPEVHIFLVGLYVILGIASVLLMHRLVRTIAKPLERTYAPWQGTPLYPGGTHPDVEFVRGYRAKTAKIILFALGWLVCMGGMYVTLAACYKQGYVEFVGWNEVSRVFLSAVHMLWPVALWALAIMRAAPPKQRA
jgi:hypothetical protein